jgi:hypothetical protein
MRFASTGHESLCPHTDGGRQRKMKKQLDMLSSVIVNYNSTLKFVLADRRQRITEAREQTRNELLEENET